MHGMRNSTSNDMLDLAAECVDVQLGSSEALLSSS
jgi:hypothetical protein